MDELSVDTNEINRIYQYKLFVIYETPEDFEDSLNEIEFENIQLINEFNVLQKILNKLKMNYNIIIEEKNEHDVNVINKIKLREYELKEIIKRNELLRNQISDMKKEKKNNNNNSSNILYFKNRQKYENNTNNKDIFPSSVTDSKDLYSRIENIYNLFKKNDSTKKDKKKKLNKNKKEDIIHMLTYIENNIDKLNNKFITYNINDYKNYELMRKIKNNIERKHKIQKSEMLRLKEKEKFLKFKEEIERKMNRIIFIQKRKINNDYDLKIIRNNNFNSYSEKQGEPNFYDFINYEK